MDGFKNSSKTHYMKGGSCEGYAKGGKVKGAAKINKVMGEFKRGELHSGSKKGPEVTNPKQAVAIALSEARKAGAKVPVKKAGGGRMDRSMMESTSARPVKVGLTPEEKAGGAAVARGNRVAREEASEAKIARMAAPKDDFRARHGIEIEKTTVKRIPADAVDRERAAKPTRGPAGQSYRSTPLIDRAVNAVRNFTGLKHGGLAVMPGKKK